MSFNSRRGGKLQPGKLQSLGELSEKPIRIEVRMKSGQWWDQLAVQVAPNVSPRARAVCNAGHLGIALYAEGQMQNENSVWAARGLEEPIYKGISQIDYSYKRPWQCILGILHLPMFTGDGEDRIGGGVVYLYLPGMPSDLPTLDRTARRFILDENGRIKRD